jgi:outer membrane protein
MNNNHLNLKRRRTIIGFLADPSSLLCLMMVTLLLVTGSVAAQPPLPPIPAPGTTLGIEEVVRTALARNRQVLDARLALEVAEGRVREAWGEVYPKLDLTGSYTRNLTTPSQLLPANIFDPDAEPGELTRVQFGSDNLWNTQLTLEQPLFQAQAFIAVGAAGRFRALQQEILRGREQAVATRVRILCYDLLLLTEQARLTRSSLQRVKASLEETKALNRAGFSSDYDVLRLEVELANLIVSLRRAENAFSMARRDLAVDLAFEDTETFILVGSLATLDLEHPEANDPDNRALLQFAGIDPTGEDRGALLARLARERSELRQLALFTDLRHTEVRLEQAEFLPRLALFGNYAIAAQQDGTPDFFGDSQQRTYARAVGVSLTIPLFSGFQRTARVAQKRTELRRAESDHRHARDRAAAELRSLLEQFEEAELRVGSQRLAMSMARRGFGIANAQYREGLGSQLELIDAEVAFRQSEFNYAEAVYDWLSTRARIDQAVGAVPLVD